MTTGDFQSRLQNVGSAGGGPGGGLRYLRRRRIGSADRNGDPLGGLANLFIVAVALALALLVGVLLAAGMGGLLTDESFTIVTNPGEPDMQVLVKEGGKISKVDTAAGGEVTGEGTLLGSFYRLADGTVVYVPDGGTAPGGATPVPGVTPEVPGVTPEVPGATPFPDTSITPGVTPTPGVTTTPSTPASPGTTAFPTDVPTPTVTLTPETR